MSTLCLTRGSKIARAVACQFCQFTSIIGGRTLSSCFRHLGRQHPMYDDIQIRIRIDAEGYTHATIVEWDEDGHERTYTADENFCTATPPTEAL
jgi:hypothetical protein